MERQARAAVRHW